MVQWKVKKKKKRKEKKCWRRPDSNQGSQGRKRKMEFSNPTLQMKYERDPGIWSKNKVHIGDSLLSQLQHTQSSA